MSKWKIADWFRGQMMGWGRMQSRDNDRSAAADMGKVLDITERALNLLEAWIYWNAGKRAESPAVHTKSLLDECREEPRTVREQVEACGDPLQEIRILADAIDELMARGKGEFQCPND